MALVTMYEVMIDGRCVRTVQGLQNATWLALDLAETRFRRSGGSVRFGVRVALPAGVAGGYRDLLEGCFGFEAESQRKSPAALRMPRA